MKQPKHLLVATDFSEPCEEALETADAFASNWGARVTLVHVFDPEAALSPVAVMSDSSRLRESVGAEVNERSQQALERVRREWLSSVAEVECRTIQHRSPSTAICELAADVNADMIVIGTHGRTGMAYLLIGSVAERVVRHAPCPVFTVRRKKGS